MAITRANMYWWSQMILCIYLQDRPSLRTTSSYLCLVCGGELLGLNIYPLAPTERHNLQKCFCFAFVGYWDMGLSSFPGAAGVLPELLMNTILLVALLKNTVRSVLQVMAGANWTPPDYEEEPDGHPQENARERRMSITQFKCLQKNHDGTSYRVSTAMECCVCLCGFQAEEEVSELHCKHFFHRGCLDKWFDNKQATCPLCRSIILLDS